MKPRNLLRRLKAYFADLQRVREEDIPYVIRFTTSDDRVLELPKVNDFPGLLLLQCTEDSNGTIEITSYWKSHDAAKSNARSFEKSLNAGHPSFMGYVQQLKIHDRPWWQRFPLGRWLLYGASLFGAFAVLQTHIAKLLESPDITLEIPGSRIINNLAGEEVSFDIAITNRSREVHAIATLSSPHLETSHSTPVNQEFLLNRMPAPIAPSATSTVKVKGEPLPPGRYTARVSIKMEAGYLRAPENMLLTKELLVWRPEPDVRLVSIAPGQEGRAVFKGEILVGKAAPKGLRCQVTIVNHSDISIEVIDSPGVKQNDPMKAHGVASARFFILNDIPSLGRIPFEITLKSSTSANDWEAIQKGSTIACERMEDVRQ